MNQVSMKTNVLNHSLITTIKWEKMKKFCENFIQIRTITTVDRIYKNQKKLQSTMMCVHSNSFATDFCNIWQSMYHKLQAVVQRKWIPVKISLNILWCNNGSELAWWLCNKDKRVTILQYYIVKNISHRNDP